MTEVIVKQHVRGMIPSGRDQGLMRRQWLLGRIRDRARRQTLVQIADTGNSVDFGAEDWHRARLINSTNSCSLAVIVTTDSVRRGSSDSAFSDRLLSARYRQEAGVIEPRRAGSSPAMRSEKNMALELDQRCQIKVCVIVRSQEKARLVPTLTQIW